MKWIQEQDEEDFEQEKKIKEWLGDSNEQFDFKHISSNGTARNTLVKASISLDQKIQEDSSGTFADIIMGSDGRTLYGGHDIDPNEIIDGYLYCLGFSEGDSEWIVKMLKLWGEKNSWLLEKSQKNSEW
jgi:hypothetical protein